MKRPTSEKLQLLRAHYTAGSRVRLLQMVKRVMVEVDGSMRFTFANEMEVII